MRLLLDTNIIIFWLTDQDCLSREVYNLLLDYDNDINISIESIRELIVAFRNKGLWRKYWKTEQQMLDSIYETNFRILPIKKEHMETYGRLQINEGQGHKDPSDHVIIAHALTEGLTLISSDSRFPFYRNQGLDLIENHR